MGSLKLKSKHRVLCGDSTSADDVAWLMDGEMAGMMVTDPPYGLNYEGGTNARKREKLAGDTGAGVYGTAIPIAAAFLSPNAVAFVWFAGRYAAPVFAAIESGGLTPRALIVWNKIHAHYGAWMSNYMPKHEPCVYAVRGAAKFVGPTNEVTVWDIDQPSMNEHHPTQKPLECMGRAIRNHALGLVLDPFLGSGTTLIAAEQLGRKCFGLELSPAYCDVIVNRWQKLTGEKAVNEKTGDLFPVAEA